MAAPTASNWISLPNGWQNVEAVNRVSFAKSWTGNLTAVLAADEREVCEVELFTREDENKLIEILGVSGATEFSGGKIL